MSRDFRRLVAGTLARDELEPAAPAGAGPLPLRMAPEGETEEQRAVTAAAETVQRLLHRDEYLRVRAAMVAFRQCYALAYGQLQALLEQEPAGSLPAMTEDVFVGAAMYQAALPFHEPDLMEGLIKTVLPWLAGKVDDHIEAETRELREAEEAADTARRSRPIPLPFDVSGPLLPAEATPAVLGRQRALVLVGWAPALHWLADQVVASLEETFVALRLCARPPRTPASHRLGYLTRNFWEGCVNTSSAVLDADVAKVLDRPLDLVVVDDLPGCYTRGFTGRHAAANAGDAHKRLAKWCTARGAALLGLVPLEDMGSPAINSPAYEQLRTFADVRQVIVEPVADDRYQIRIGPGSVIEAPRAEVDGAGSIIVSA